MGIDFRVQYVYVSVMRRIGIYISNRQDMKFKELSEMTGISVSEVIRRALDWFLVNDPEQDRRGLDWIGEMNLPENAPFAKERSRDARKKVSPKVPLP